MELLGFIINILAFTPKLKNIQYLEVQLILRVERSGITGIVFWDLEYRTNSFIRKSLFGRNHAENSKQISYPKCLQTTANL